MGVKQTFILGIVTVGGWASEIEHTDCNLDVYFHNCGQFDLYSGEKRKSPRKASTTIKIIRLAIGLIEFDGSK